MADYVYLADEIHLPVEIFNSSNPLSWPHNQWFLGSSQLKHKL